MDYLNALSEWFWSPSIWLPPGKTWADMKSTDTLTMPEFDDLKPCAVYFTAFFIILRYFIVEPLVIKPIGRSWGINERAHSRPPPNKQLEKLFVAYRHKKISSSLTINSAIKLRWTERQVERWMRHRKAAEKATDMFKFCDCLWQVLYYCCYCIYGVYILYDKPWVWDIRHCWYNYPFQNFDADIWYYYMIPLGFYLASTLTFLFQHHRKDAVQMLLHHVITIILIVFSWAVNLVKGGTLILLVHECADIPLLLAKACGLLGKQHFMDYLFVLFLFVWTVTRLGLFPFWIIRSGIFESYVIVQMMYPIYYLFNGLLLILLAFHIMWTILIIRILVRKLKFKETKDVRSDSDDLSNSFDETEVQQINGSFSHGNKKIL